MKNRSFPPPRVVKFGGASLRDGEAVRSAGRLIQAQNTPLVAVCSAMEGITDLLLATVTTALSGDCDETGIDTYARRHHEVVRALFGNGKSQAVGKRIDETTTELRSMAESLAVLGEMPGGVKARVVARGERVMGHIMTAYLQSLGLEAEFCDPTELIVINDRRGVSLPDMERSRELIRGRLEKLLAAGQVPVVPGYLAVDEDGRLTTLGRGGSDLSATVIGAALEAESVTLYKTVDGLMTADPRHVSGAVTIPELHYREAAELAYYGAEVLHTRTIAPLANQGIPLYVKNANQPDFPGTRVAGDVAPGAHPVKALTAIREQALITVEGKGMIGVPGIAGRTFSALARTGTSVSVISQASSEASLCFLVPGEEAHNAVRTLEKEFHYEMQAGAIDAVRLEAGQAVVAAVGLGMKGTPGIAGRTFSTLGRSGISIEAIAQGSSELNISLVVADAEAPQALDALHREFRLGNLRATPQRQPATVRLACLGFGQIGRTLAHQLVDQEAYFTEKMGLTLSPVAVADRSGWVVEENGMTMEALATLVAKKERGHKLATRPQAATADGLTLDEPEDVPWQSLPPSGIFVDVTADATEKTVEEALRHGMHVVLANKKPLAADLATFYRLFETARDQGLALRYEATVGAGLPILDTIAKLTDSGDHIHSVVGCFSGTLGYLMGELEAGTPFSASVRKAYDLGYTEPDPRDDLSGMDVARKALILARTLGHELNLDDVEVESLVPANAAGGDAEAFLQSLASADEPWRERIEKAADGGRVLRYVARIEPGAVKVGVEELDKSHPLGRLQGTDNQVILETERYKTNPLVVTGPGAGADVTAAGVLGDVLAVATQSRHE